MPQMQVTGAVGPQVSADTPTGPPFRQGRSGEAIVTELHGKYYEQVYRGNVFVASNVAAQAVSVALATTYTGLCVSNPIGSQKNLVLLQMGFALSVAPVAIASLHLIGGYSATVNVVHTTPLAAPGVQNCLLGVGPQSSMKADTAATIPTPGYILPLSHGFTAAALPNAMLPWTDLGGALIVPPGGFIALGALTAVTGFAGLLWEEVPV